MKKTDFKKITLEDKPLIDDYFRRFPQYHSEHNFLTLFSWEHYAPCEYAVINDHLILSNTINGRSTCHAPVGEFDPALFEELISFAKKNTGDCAIAFYEDKYIPYMHLYHPETPVYHSRGCSDYYYRTKELAELSGQKYLNIRRHINRFNTKYQYTVETIKPETIPELHDMLDKWSDTKIADTNTVLNEEVRAAHTALENWHELGCEGLVIRVGPRNKIGAAAIWGEMNYETAVIHFEKGLAQYKGIYKVINQETARKLLGKYTWINRESDMDVAGLREAKLRYHPEKCAKIWYIKRKEIS